jgi:pyruvate/2-oxoglutarate dehydrogenase complex dihydrolipoamide acyltransferase (E2) component
MSAGIQDVCVSIDLWDQDTQGVIVNWIYADGARVRAGDVICEIMVEKAQMDFTAPLSGRLQILVPADQLIRPGDLIARIEPTD